MGSSIKILFMVKAKLLRITAYCNRFISRIQRRTATNGDNAGLTSTEMNTVKVFWLQQMQHELFPEEIESLRNETPINHSSKIAGLLPYLQLDCDDLMRVHGQLHHLKAPEQEKHPIIIKAHPLLNQIISYTHLKLLHCEPRLVLVHLRQEYWILRVHQLVRAIIYCCIPCTRYRTQPVSQLMGDLPEYRINPVEKQFDHTGIDYAGPILIPSSPGRGRASYKAYIAVFICLTIKAVHIELVSDCLTAAFIAVYHRFVSRRGRPCTIHSNNVTTFHDAERELTASIRAITHDPDFVNRMSIEGLLWKFIPSGTPNFGGIWEAAVKSIKYHLRRCIGSLTLTFEEVKTALFRIEAGLNSRPFTAISANIDDFSYLTPGHFLIGTVLVASPEPSFLDLRENRRSRWQTVQSVAEHFWKAWRQNYLHEIQQRPKKYLLKKLIRQDQLVLLKDTGLNPSQWSLARIIKSHPGEDGLVRVVTVRTSTTELKRPITKICFLPIDIYYNEENQPPTAGGGNTTVSLAIQMRILLPPARNNFVIIRSSDQLLSDHQI